MLKKKFGLHAVDHMQVTAIVLNIGVPTNMQYHQEAFLMAPSIIQKEPPIKIHKGLAVVDQLAYGLPTLRQYIDTFGTSKLSLKEIVIILFARYIIGTSDTNIVNMIVNTENPDVPKIYSIDEAAPISDKKKAKALTCFNDLWTSQQPRREFIDLVNSQFDNHRDEMKMWLANLPRDILNVQEDMRLQALDVLF
jgi:hypothetical protein